MQHLENRGFPDVMWLRAPDTSDIHGLDPENNYRRRLMIIYYTTVLPAVRTLSEEEGIDGVYRIEDSCILAPNVTYVQVAKKTEGCEAGIFGYAHHEKKQTRRLVWHEGHVLQYPVVRTVANHIAKHTRVAFGTSGPLAC
jgi:hypothetical protein